MQSMSSRPVRQARARLFFGLFVACGFLGCSDSPMESEQPTEDERMDVDAGPDAASMRDAETDPGDLSTEQDEGVHDDQGSDLEVSDLGDSDRGDTGEDQGERAGFDDFPIERAQGAGARIVASLSEDAAANAAALEQAFDAANPGGTVSIPAGTYAFTRVIELSDLHDIVVEGNGARLVLTQGASIHVFRSSQLRFADLVLDWDWDAKPLAYLGVVERIDETAIEFDFPLDATIPDRIDWWNVEMVDRMTFSPTPGGSEWFGLGPAAQTRTDENSLRVSGLHGPLQVLQVGDAVRIRQHANANTSSHVWYLDDVSHTVFERVTIHSGSYMGYVLNHDTHHILLDSCRIVPDPEAEGSKRILSTFADGLHIAHFTGYLGVIDSEFSHQGDDAMNIKQNVASVVHRISDTSMRITTERWFSPYAEGDTLELRDYADFAILGTTAPVASVTWQGDGVVLTFEGPLPPFTGHDVVVINERYNVGQYFIRNNHFHSNRARGILPKLPNGVIAGNRFEGMSMPAILFEFGRWDGRHAEGSFIDQVEITDNELVNVNVYGWYPEDISYRIKQMNYTDTSMFPNLFSNLTIHGNTRAR